MMKMIPQTTCRLSTRGTPGNKGKCGYSRDGGFEKSACADRLLVRHDPCEGDARGIVDTDMNELPAGAACIALAFAVAGDALANSLEAPQFLDVEMDQLARMLSLIAPHRRGRLEGAEAVQAQPLEDPADGCRRDAGLLGNRLAGQAPATFSGHA